MTAIGSERRRAGRHGQGSPPAHGGARRVGPDAREPQKTEAPRTPRPDSLAPSDPRREVVAVVLSDGTVHKVADTRPDPARRPRLSNGTLSGPGWTMWWEMRSWDDAR